MSKRDSQEYKIGKASEMMVGALPPLDRHPGIFIRDVLLPEYGLTNVARTAGLLGVNRAGFIRVLNGQNDVSRDLAYKLGALMRDEVADLMIAFQQAYDLEQERERRESFKATIERVEPPNRE
jgi:plasmid maintenance system antidote protein VapI